MNYIYERKINYYETDRMVIVHHSNYIRFLEEARCAFLDALDMPYSMLESLGIMIPVLGVQCDFKHHVTFNDTILIDVSIKAFNGVRLVMQYTITEKNSGNLVLVGETKHCFTNTDLKPINLKKHFANIYEKFNKSL